MLDHVVFSVPSDKFEDIITFYLAALGPIGYTKQKYFPNMAVGFGTSPDNAKFWISVKEGATSGIHIGFRANDHATVDKFYDEAIKAGGKDNGKPGIRSMYHPNYYAAFIIDPVGNNIEVVDHSAH